ncbi:unnamed protein product [Closterium sp. Naga37s-1]|nr:unnamed protein product [Closterium sp. Naga37s-1]
MGLGREGPSAQALMPPGPRDDLRAGAGAGEGAEAEGAEAAPAEDDHLPEDDQEAVLDSVVKLFAVGSSPNYRLPWQNKPQREVTGSGFVIMGRRILTSAHIVADQAFVLVRKHGSPKKYLAQPPTPVFIPQPDPATFSLPSRSPVLTLSIPSPHQVLAVVHECDLVHPPPLPLTPSCPRTLPPPSPSPSPPHQVQAVAHEFGEDKGGGGAGGRGGGAMGDFGGGGMGRGGGGGLGSRMGGGKGMGGDMGMGMGGRGEAGRGVGGAGGNEEFWAGLNPLPLGDVPQLQESVAVVGYPQGGDNISISMGVVSRVEPPSTHTAGRTCWPYRSTPHSTHLSRPILIPTGSHPPTLSGGDNISISMGVVSRVEPTKYAHSGAHLLAIQIDAAINPGNSGGPALVMTHVPVVAGDSTTSSAAADAAAGAYGSSSSSSGGGGRETSRSGGSGNGRDLMNSHRMDSQLQGESAGRAGGMQRRSGLEEESDSPSIKGLGWGDEGGDGMLGLGGEDGREEWEGEEGEEEVGVGGGWAEIEAERAAEEAAARAAPVAMRVEYRVVGVAFQNLTGAENIGYIVPTPIIHRFLHDAALHHRRFHGFSSLGVACQPLDNWQLRAHLRLPPTATGVLVNAVQPLSESSRWIKKDDVLTAFDCVPIADDGSVLFRKRERLPFDYLVSLKGSGERAMVSVYRGGQLMHFDMTVNPLPPLVAAQQWDSAPSYFIFAGLVFMPLSQPYLHEYGPDWLHSSPRRLCDLALRNLPEKPGQQIIILSRVLPDEVNGGYERLADLQVLKVNGMEVDNIRQLKDAVFETSGPFVRFDLEDGRIIAIDMAAARKSNAQILRRYRVPSASSWDLRQMADSNSHDSHSRF